MALADVFGANFVRKAAELGKPDIADYIATVTEKHAASLALAFANFRVARPTQRIDEIAENLRRQGQANSQRSHQCAGWAGLHGSSRKPVRGTPRAFRSQWRCNRQYRVYRVPPLSGQSSHRIHRQEPSQYPPLSNWDRWFGSGARRCRHHAV